MAAYAALVSLVHIIEQIQHHPRPPFYLDNNHAQCLIQKVTFLQDFLELYSHVRIEEIDRLESHIAEAAYAAEDLIESHVVDQILAQSAQHGRRICSADFYQALQKVVQDMDSINNEVLEIKDRMGSVKDFRQHRRSLMPAADSSRCPPQGQNDMVGRDDVLEHIIRDKLTLKQHSNLQVIPIVGMGGIGKTTLAKNIYKNQYTVQYFDIHAWATISQEYSVKEILLELLLCLDDQESRESLSSEVELRDRLHRSLFGKMFLIILDDMWKIEAWYKIKSSFPNNNNGSRVIITTRQSDMALDLTSGHADSIIEMKFLNDDISWNLLCKIVFGSEDVCPSELKETGRKIAANCGGLPLAIVVIGGLLAKSEKTLEYWEYIAENSHSLEENERCLSVLYTSYNHLPIHLKPCFLYMASFEEDAKVSANLLIWYWIVEGFLKRVSDKRMKELAVEYLNDLIDRNLILVGQRYRDGEIKFLKIHDLLRELCLRESRKDKFFLVTGHHSLNHHSLNTHRRVLMRGSILETENQCYFPDEICDASQSASLVRALVCNTVKVLPSPNLRLLRILSTDESLESFLGDEYFRSNYSCQLVNLRFLKATYFDVTSYPSSSIHLFWNIQILVINADIEKSVDIWKMPLLRCMLVVEGFHLKNPGQDDFVLRNLCWLATVANFRCSEKVVKRIPNVQALYISYDKEFIGSRYCLNNLARLHKLEEVGCKFLETPTRSELMQNLTFPQCLKKLNLKGCRLHWEDISIKIGSLSLLQELRLSDESVIGPEWETIEGQFCNLKVLKILNCNDLKCWKTDSNHFPCLERLVLSGLKELKEIPSAIGHITTMGLIKLRRCSYSAMVSAKEIAKEQLEEFENQDLHVQVAVTSEEYEEMKSWASPNFEVITFRSLWRQLIR